MKETKKYRHWKQHGDQIELHRKNRARNVARSAESLRRMAADKLMPLIAKMTNWQRQQYHRYLCTGAPLTLERVEHYANLVKPS